MLALVGACEDARSEQKNDGAAKRKIGLHVTVAASPRRSRAQTPRGDYARQSPESGAVRRTSGPPSGRRAVQTRRERDQGPKRRCFTLLAPRLHPPRCPRRPADDRRAPRGGTRLLDAMALRDGRTPGRYRAGLSSWRYGSLAAWHVPLLAQEHTNNIDGDQPAVQREPDGNWPFRLLLPPGTHLMQGSCRDCCRLA